MGTYALHHINTYNMANFNATLTLRFHLSHSSVVDCGPLADPDNGQVSATTTTYTSTADYTCITGYNLVGVNQRNCTAAGTWSDGEPTCQSERYMHN